MISKRMVHAQSVAGMKRGGWVAEEFTCSKFMCMLASLTFRPLSFVWKKVEETPKKKQGSFSLLNPEKAWDERTKNTTKLKIRHKKGAQIQTFESGYFLVGWGSST